jgi:hypothetical protein
MWESLSRLLHEQIANNYETILRCNRVLDKIEDDWEHIKTDEYREKSLAERVIFASQKMLETMAHADRDEIELSKLKRIQLDILELP